MRALVITTSYPLAPQSLSGRFIEELLHGLAARGGSFHVLTPAPPAGPGRHDAGPVTVEAVGYAGHRLGLAHAGGIPDRIAAAPALAAVVPGMWHALEQAAARRVGDGGFDLIWSHWLLPAGWIGAGLARASGIPHLATAHGGDVHLIERLVRLPGARAALAARFARTRLSAPAVHTAARVRAALGTSGVGVAPLPAEVAPRRGARPPGAPLQVLFLGRFEAIKGADRLLAAAARFGRADLEIVMAGEGRESAALHRAAARLACRVSFPGALTGAARLGALAAADVLVVPSRRMRSGRSEGLPHAATLALANGVPVIAAGEGALAELLSAHRAGVAFDAGAGEAAAVRSLAEAVGALAHDRARLAALSRGARRAGAPCHAARALPAWERLLEGAAGAAERPVPGSRALACRTAP